MAKTTVADEAEEAWSINPEPRHETDRQRGADHRGGDPGSRASYVALATRRHAAGDPVLERERERGADQRPQRPEHRDRSGRLGSEASRDEREDDVGQQARKQDHGDPRPELGSRHLVPSATSRLGHASSKSKGTRPAPPAHSRVQVQSTFASDRRRSATTAAYYKDPRPGDKAKPRPAAEAKPLTYPRPDGALTFDRLSSVFLSGTGHDEDQPPHLQVRDLSLQKASEHDVFGGPSALYCPAAVYEWVGEGAGLRYQINTANCVHCKTCDIKDPNQNINWVPPEGGGGPNYRGM